MKKGSKSGLFTIFGPILGFYTKNSPRNSGSPHFMITYLLEPKITKWGYLLYLQFVKMFLKSKNSTKNLQCNTCQPVVSKAFKS